MLAVAMTLATIFATMAYVVFMVVKTYESTRKRDWQDGLRTGEHLAVLMIPFALAASLFMQTSAFGIAVAIHLGGIWASPYVFHIPTAWDFWAEFWPAHLSGRAEAYAKLPRAAALTDVFGMVAVAIGIALIARFVAKPEAKQYFKKKRVHSVAIWCLAHGLLYLLAIEAVLFLLAYVIGSLMFVTEYWWLLLVLLFMGGMGGGKMDVFNKDGKKVGEVNRDAF